MCVRSDKSMPGDNRYLWPDLRFLVYTSFPEVAAGCCKFTEPGDLFKKLKLLITDSYSH